MRGICLCGGSGTRLYPITMGTSKQMLPVYDKPMCYYPISVLMLAGIREILIITTPEDAPAFKRLLGDGHQFGLSLSYAIQEKPNGIAQALIIGEEFIGDDSVCLVLGDNIFHGANFSEILRNAQMSVARGYAVTFGYPVKDPERYGVAEFAKDGETCLSIEEKPKHPKSEYAVTGLYMYPKGVSKKAREVTPSARGELEITALNALYLKEQNLVVRKLPRGFAWLDTGTFESLSDAASYIKTVETRQGLQVACLEEIAYQKGWITKEDMEHTSDIMSKNDYGKYLKKIIDNGN